MGVRFFPVTKEIDLSGSRDGLLGLAGLVAAGGGEMEAGDPPAGIGGEVALTRVLVRPAAGEAVTIIADADRRTLTISGDLDRLRVLAGNLRGIAEAEDGGHLHIDHHPGHFYLGAGSHPLVVNGPHGGMPRR